MNYSFDDIIETLRIKHNKISMRVLTSSGIDEGVYVIVAPTLMVSGYGETETEAKESLLHNLTVFVKDIMELSQKDRDDYLLKLGFKKEAFKNKNFSKTYVDSQGVLRGFQFESLRTSFLETTV